MKGKIRIFNSAKNLGRIILENDRESGLITFPPNFEDGDLAEVSFHNNDPSQRMLKLTALSADWHYGFVSNPPVHDKAGGSIIVTYPHAKGLLFFFASELPSSQKNHRIKGLNLKFKIRKTLDGRQKAIDINDRLDRSEEYKCKLPQFGLLKIVSDTLKTGIVKSIINETATTTLSGTIKDVRSYEGSDNPDFGFIELDRDRLRAYFNAKAYRQFYKQPPKKGDKVNFKTTKTSKGERVREFCPPCEQKPLPLERQHGFFEPDSKPGEKIYFSVQDFMQTYDREPEVGDLLFFNLFEGNRIIFYPNDTSVPEKTLITGRINQKRTQTSPPPSKTIVSGFAGIDPTAIYCLYTKDTGQIAEVRRFNPEVLSEALSCYKDRGLQDHHKLQAIESLIHYEYEDKHITQKKLGEERITILHQQIETAILTGDMATAIKQESRLQRLEYDPERLQHFSCMKPEYILDTSKSTSQIVDMDTLASWNIMTDQVNSHLEIPALSSPWMLIHDAHTAVHDTAPADRCWALELEDTGLQKDPPPTFLNNEKFSLIFDAQDNESEA